MALIKIKDVKISIHALREEGDVKPKTKSELMAISIHALREEGDWITVPSTPPWFNFYPRPPRGGRRRHPRHAFPGPCDFYPRPPRGGRPSEVLLSLRQLGISIHALREEGDGSLSVNTSVSFLFLSTPSARRATRRLWRRM